MRTLSLVILALLLFAGGKPSRGTPADKRLSRNNPNAGKPKPKPVLPVPAKKGGKG